MLTIAFEYTILFIFLQHRSLILSGLEDQDENSLLILSALWFSWVGLMVVACTPAAVMEPSPATSTTRTSHCGEWRNRWTQLKILLVKISQHLKKRQHRHQRRVTHGSYSSQMHKWLSSPQRMGQFCRELYYPPETGPCAGGCADASISS